MSGRSTSKVAKSSNRGSAKGERRGGRQKGVPNKATASIREIARQYTDDAVNALVKVLTDDESPHAAIVSAANSILDRGYGKPSQSIEHSGTIEHIVSKEQRDAAVAAALRADGK